MPWNVDVERVPEISGRMVWRHIEHLEVGHVVFDFRPLVDHETELTEYLGDRSDRFGDGMERAAGDGAAGQRDIQPFGEETLRLNDSVQLRAANRKSGLDRLAHLVRNGTDARSILCREGADAAQDGS